MKKSLKIILIIFIIASLLFVITGCGNKDEENNTNTEENNFESSGKSKTYNIFSEVFSDGNYIIALEGEADLGEGKEDATMTMAVKGENIYIDLNATSNHATVMYKDGITYMISHDDRMYITIQGKDENTFVEDMTIMSKEDLSKIETQEYETGKETIDGTEYEYEEYKDEETQTTERYYFSGNDLRYVKSINEDGEEELMRVVQMSSEVDDSIFKEPTNYEKMEL